MPKRFWPFIVLPESCRNKKNFFRITFEIEFRYECQKTEKGVFLQKRFAKTCDEEKEWSCLKNNVIKRVDDINFLSQYFYVFGAPF